MKYCLGTNNKFHLYKRSSDTAAICGQRITSKSVASKPQPKPLCTICENNK